MHTSLQFKAMATKKSSKEKMFSRDVRRRVDVISKKTKEMGEMGVPAVFLYIAPWTGGIYTIGDGRITGVIQDVMERILQSVSNAAADPGSSTTGLCLPKLPAKLDEINCRTLQSILVAIAKDMNIDWSGEKPHYWPSEIPFVNPRTVPTECKGK